ARRRWKRPARRCRRRAERSNADHAREPGERPGRGCDGGHADRVDPDRRFHAGRTRRRRGEPGPGVVRRRARPRRTIDTDPATLAYSASSENPGLYIHVAWTNHRTGPLGGPMTRVGVGTSTKRRAVDAGTEAAR